MSYIDQVERLVQVPTIDTYATLDKVTRDTNKYYHIYLRPREKGVLMYNNKRSNKIGFEVFSIYGPKRENYPPRIHHVGFSFSRQAAERSAQRLLESKRQKGYDTYLATDPITNQYIKTATTQVKPSKVLFEEIPPAKLKMTANQRNRFTEIVE
tara:strand:+ start:311 stop:772 length:462 start_codon:yes stop_codon:yes gene_type:complete